MPAPIGPSLDQADLAHLGIGRRIRHAAHVETEERLEFLNARGRLRPDHPVEFDPVIAECLQARLDLDDAGLVAQLQRVKQLYPEKVDAVVTVADAMPYEQLIKAMDNLLGAGFSAISVATGAN